MNYNVNLFRGLITELTKEEIIKVIPDDPQDMNIASAFSAILSHKILEDLEKEIHDSHN